MCISEGRRAARRLKLRSRHIHDTVLLSFITMASALPRREVIEFARTKWLGLLCYSEDRTATVMTSGLCQVRRSVATLLRGHRRLWHTLKCSHTEISTALLHRRATKK